MAFEESVCVSEIVRDAKFLLIAKNDGVCRPLEVGKFNLVQFLLIYGTVDFCLSGGFRGSFVITIYSLFLLSLDFNLVFLHLRRFALTFGLVFVQCFQKHLSPFLDPLILSGGSLWRKVMLKEYAYEAFEEFHFL